jgi:hypothetical protein
VGDKARTLGLLLGVGGGYALWQQLPLEQALNGFISVVVFNIIYDLLLRWLAWPGLACFESLQWQRCWRTGSAHPRLCCWAGYPLASLLTLLPTCCVCAARS